MSTPPRLRPEQRRRLRRLVTWTFSAVVGLEAVVIALAFVPASSAFTCIVPCPVEDSVLDELMEEVRDMIRTDINGELRTAYRTLNSIDREQDVVRQRAVQHARPHGNTWDPDLAPVTSTPSSKIQGVSFAADSPSALLAEIVPGARPWDDYHREYLASADTTLTTLRTTLDALHAHNQDIEKDSVLARLSDLADSVGREGVRGRGHLAMDKLEIQSSLEVARQLHALRAQYAISSNAYAVAESHKTGSEARSHAEDKESNCRVFAALAGGVAGDLFGAITCPR